MQTAFALLQALSLTNAPWLCDTPLGLSCTVWLQYTTRPTDRQIERAVGIRRLRYRIGGLKMITAALLRAEKFSFGALMVVGRDASPFETVAMQLIDARVSMVCVEGGGHSASAQGHRHLE